MTTTSTRLADNELRELGRRLQLTRAGHWFAGNQGDPYALILRAMADAGAFADEICTRGRLFRSDLMEAWVTADPEITRTVRTDPRFDVFDCGAGRPDQHLLPMSPAFPHFDQQELGRLEKLLDPHVSHDEMHPRMIRSATSVLDECSSTGELDIVVDIARPATVSFVRSLLGFRESDPVETSSLVRCAPQLDARFCPQTLAVARESAEAVTVLAERIKGTVEQRTQASERRDDLIGALLKGEASPGDVERIALQLAITTAEPATTLAANTVRRLLSDPEQWMRIADPAEAEAAVERTMNSLPPARLESRVARENLNWGEHEVSADDHVVVLAGVTNSASGPIGGPDLALAMPLIRLVSTSLVNAIATAFPRMRDTGEALMRPRSPVLGRYVRFPVVTG